MDDERVHVVGETCHRTGVAAGGRSLTPAAHLYLPPEGRRSPQPQLKPRGERCAAARPPGRIPPSPATGSGPSPGRGYDHDVYRRELRLRGVKPRIAPHRARLRTRPRIMRRVLFIVAGWQLRTLDRAPGPNPGVRRSVSRRRQAPPTVVSRGC